jgi:hypothetical protein
MATQLKANELSQIQGTFNTATEVLKTNTASLKDAQKRVTDFTKKGVGIAALVAGFTAVVYAVGSKVLGGKKTEQAPPTA